MRITNFMMIMRLLYSGLDLQDFELSMSKSVKSNVLIADDFVFGIFPSRCFRCKNACTISGMRIKYNE